MGIPTLLRSNQPDKNGVFFATAHMVDVVLDQSIDIPEGIYFDGQEQGNWFRDCLLQVTAVQCPKV